MDEDHSAAELARASGALLSSRLSSLMDRTVKVDMWILGPRNYPQAHVKLPEAVVSDLPDLIASARGLNPAVQTEAVVRAIWRLGSYRLGQNLLRRIPVRVADLPTPARAEPRP